MNEMWRLLMNIDASCLDVMPGRSDWDMVKRNRTDFGAKLYILTLSIFTATQAFFYKIGGDENILNYSYAVKSVALNLFMIALTASIWVLNFVICERTNWPCRKIFSISIHSFAVFFIFYALVHTHFAGTLSSFVIMHGLLVVVGVTWLIGSMACWLYFSFLMLGLVGLFTLEAFGVLPYSPVVGMNAEIPTKLFLDYRFFVMNFAILFPSGTVLILVLNHFRANLRRSNDQLSDAMDKIRVLATHDPLTGLLNRRSALADFERELLRANRQSRPLTVVMADMDNFKLINDSYGHPTGDKVLKTAASILSQSFRPYDIVARFGGEEFLVIMLEANMNVALSRIEKARMAIQNTVITTGEGTDIRVTVSFGCCTNDFNKPKSTNELLANADKALYESKNSGKNMVSVCKVA